MTIVDQTVPVLTHVIDHHVVSVQVESPQPPDQQHSQRIRQVDNSALTSLI